MTIVNTQKVYYCCSVDIRDLTLARIRRLRNEMKISQAEAASRAGVNQQTWARWESGQVGIDLDTLQIIARVLETTPEALIAHDPEYTPLSQEIAERVQHLSDADMQEILAIIRIKEQRSRVSEGVPYEVGTKKAPARRRRAA